MSNQHLEQEIAALSARVTHQNAQIADLEKQLTDMQAAMSCFLGSLNFHCFELQNKMIIKDT
ncbi:hypothetical protein [Moellerella wisconsensis]|uniref:hypothetical protein n=1 Tax=Moellerella wisconsensis TaxID=158849 RepID=UPI0030763A65